MTLITKNPQIPVASKTADEIIIETFARLDQTALGLAVGICLGSAIFAATNFLIIKGGFHIGGNLSLLSQFFWGYDVTFTGSVVGFAYGCTCGFLVGWLTAFLRNFLISVYLRLIKLKAELNSIGDFMDNP